MSTSEEHHFARLTPETILDAVDSLGLLTNGQFLALNSYENRVFRITLEDDSHIVAKFYRPDRWSDEAILEEHDFTLDLNHEEIPVIPPLTFSGTTLHFYDSFRFAVFPYQGGRAFETDNPQQLEQLGRFLGRIHAMSATQPFKYRPTISIENYIISPSAFLLEQHFLPDYLESNYRSLIDQLTERTSAIFHLRSNFKQIRLHGDCHPGNILSMNDSPYIVDFDDARMGPAIQDLWMFLSGDRYYQMDRLGDLLTGYEQFYEFDPSELGLIEALRTLRIVHYAGWLAQRWDDPAFPVAFPWFNSIRYWEEHIQTLREQLSALDEPSLIW